MERLVLFIWSVIPRKIGERKLKNFCGLKDREVLDILWLNKIYVCDMPSNFEYRMSKHDERRLNRA